MESSITQQRYWSELVQLRAQIYYLQVYRASSERRERILNISLAVTSSISLAAWAISQGVDWLWPLIIAVTHVINASKQFFPFEKRIEEIGNLNQELTNLALFAERKWYAVSQGKLDDKEIHALKFDIKKRKQDAEDEHLSHALPEKHGFHGEARRKTERYFRNFY